ncbi:MAG TPA: winged helix-turn-helix domain-containing protein [Thermoanaerobaculia bacterium]|jgi:DNA-binding winged helix-turn-helix (wHTH) protein|nr:winged helix-turn-helix domain-containing protein [Thermoanaerobaculia bacterium]
MRVCFGDCTFDGETREILRDGRPVHLSPKAFRLLELLLEARPRALSKAEIHEKVWPDAFVSEATLASLVAEIREAIGEHGKDARHIRTVHGFGYSFAGAAAETPRASAQPGAGSSWRLVWENRVIPLEEGETVLGRNPDRGIQIPSDGVSRRHAKIVIAGPAASIEDLGSKNGTFVRDEKITGPVALRHDDVVRLGGLTLAVRWVRDEPSTLTEIGEAAGKEAPAKQNGRGRTPPASGRRKKTGPQ